MEGIALKIRGLAAWVPGLETQAEIGAWARGERTSLRTNPQDLIFNEGGGLPSLDFVPAMQRRRMTPLAKLAVALAHRLKEDLLPQAKLYFVSLAGESSRQLQVNTMVLQDNEILPATFSTSVFNTPPAMVSIILGLKNGYSALYPPAGDFSSAVRCAVAPLVAGTRPQVLLIYADARSPDEYQSLDGAQGLSWGFAALLETDTGRGSGVDFKSCVDSEAIVAAASSPQGLLCRLLEVSGSVLT